MSLPAPMSFCPLLSSPPVCWCAEGGACASLAGDCVTAVKGTERRTSPVLRRDGVPPASRPRRGADGIRGAGCDAASSESRRN
ncbi:hypothetical protein DFH09DRAFT_1172244, partial [Mycena vulgaris]